LRKTTVPAKAPKLRKRISHNLYAVVPADADGA